GFGFAVSDAVDLSVDNAVTVRRRQIERLAGMGEPWRQRRGVGNVGPALRRPRRGGIAVDGAYWQRNLAARAVRRLDIERDDFTWPAPRSDSRELRKLKSD